MKGVIIELSGRRGSAGSISEQGGNFESARWDQGVRMELSVESAQRRKSARSSHQQRRQLGVSRELSGSSDSDVSHWLSQYAAGSVYRAESQQGLPPPSPFTFLGVQSLKERSQP